MLDMGFLPDLDRIVRLLPTNRQGLLFSATFSNEIRKLGRSFLKNPVEIEVAARNATADTVTQIAYPLAGNEKRAAVVHLVKSRGFNQVIVFSNTKIGTGRLARELVRDLDASGYFVRSDDHTSELQSLMRISYAVF